MKLSARLFPINRWLEPLLAAGIATALAYAMWHLYDLGWMPQPFFYNPNDMWGDWFNTAYWAYDPGTYDTYRTVYPPLSFVFLRTFTLDGCYPLVGSGSDPSVGLPARDCDWLGIAALHGCFILNAIVVSLALIKHDRKTAPWRAFTLVAGFPSVEALERGNLIIPTLTLVILGFGPLLKSARLRWLAIGMAVNFKVYVIAALMPQLLRRRWRWVEGALLAIALVYFISYGLLGIGTPREIYSNLYLFSQYGVAGNFLDVWFAVTVTGLESLLDNWNGPAMGLLGSRWVNFLLFLLPTMQHTVQATIVIAAAMAWLRPEVISRYRLTNLGISLALITSESGGYTAVLTFFFTLLEPWKGFGRKWAILAVYILCIPADIPIGQGLVVAWDTFLPNRTVIADYDVMIGPFIRPIIFMTIPFALSLVTMREVWTDIRHQGWKNRWRYRHDAPLLPGVARPTQPAETAA